MVLDVALSLCVVGLGGFDFGRISFVVGINLLFYTLRLLCGE